MRFALRVLPDAERDVDGIAAYMSQNSLGQAMKFYESGAATYRMILEAPNRWPLYEMSHPRLQNLRKRGVLRYRFYQFDIQFVTIIRVLHGARNLTALFSEMQWID